MNKQRKKKRKPSGAIGRVLRRDSSAGRHTSHDAAGNDGFLFSLFAPAYLALPIAIFSGERVRVRPWLYLSCRSHLRTCPERNCSTGDTTKAAAWYE